MAKIGFTYSFVICAVITGLSLITGLLYFTPITLKIDEKVLKTTNKLSIDLLKPSSKFFCVSKNNSSLCNMCFIICVKQVNHNFNNLGC